MQADARVRPEYTYGDLVTVTTVPNVAEGEMLRGMLLEEGIPSMVRPARSSAIPQVLGIGPHEVVVPESAYETAYQLVHGEPPQPAHPGSRSRPAPGNLLAVVLIVAGALAFLVWLSGNV
jgi:hypothetical protein